MVMVLVLNKLNDGWIVIKALQVQNKNKECIGFIADHSFSFLIVIKIL